MPYFLKDVKAAVELINRERPGTIIERGDYGYKLCVADAGLNSPAAILFQPRRDNIGQPAIMSDDETIRNVLFLLGSQWMPEQVEQMRRLKPRD